MVSNLAGQVEHMEAQLAVVRAFVAIVSYIGSAAAVSPMGSELIRRTGLPQLSRTS